MDELYLFDKLSKGYSTQAKTANQFWLITSITSLISITANPDIQPQIELPFTLGKVTQYDFYFIILMIIAILVIAFSSAMIQTIRTRALLQRLVDRMAATCIAGIHIQDILDSVLIPTYNRVAPISQFLLGGSQFLGDVEKKSKLPRRTGIVLYCALKIVTFLVLYTLPAFALISGWMHLGTIKANGNIHLNRWILTPALSLSLLSLLILATGDFGYFKRVVGRISK